MVHQIPCRAAMNSVEWNPKYNLLAYAGDDKNKYQADEGIYNIEMDDLKLYVHKIPPFIQIVLICFLFQVFSEYLALRMHKNYVEWKLQKA